MIDFGPVVLRNIFPVGDNWLFVYQFKVGGHYAVIKHVPERDLTGGTQQKDDGSWQNKSCR
jgi:hypothetical protein